MRARAFACLAFALAAAGLNAETLENADLRLEVSPKTGSIVRLMDKRSGVELVTDQQQVRLFQLLLTPIGERTRRILSWQQQVEAGQDGPDRLELHYSGLQPEEDKYIFGSGLMHFPEPKLPLDVVVKLHLDGGHVVAQIHIENGSEETIRGVAFPFIGGLTPRVGDETAKIVLPSLSQRVFAHTLAGAFTGERANRYPAMLAASWLNFELGPLSLGIEARAGLASQDAWFALNEGNFRPGSAYRGRYQYPFVAWLSWPHIAGGEEWTSGEMRIHVHAGDWHQLASEHREWSRAQTAPATDDKWRERIGFATYRLKSDDNTILRNYADLDALAGDAAKAGLDRLVIEGWREIEGMANPAPRGEIADPRLGGAVALKAANDRLAARGVDLLFAFHPALINVRADDYPSSASLWAVRTSRDDDQIPVNFVANTWDYPAALDSGHLRIEIDPGSGATDYLLSEASRLKSEYGMRHLLLKGIGQRAFMSYARNRGIAPQDTYRVGYARLLGGLRELFAGGLLLNEGFNDLVNPYADGAYTWDQTHDAAILPYSIPWRYLSDDVEALDYAAANISFAHKALINLVIDGGEGTVARYAAFADHLSALRALKQATPSCYADAEYRDHEGLGKIEAAEQTVVSVFHNPAFGAVGIVAANLGADPAPLSIELPDAGADASALLYRELSGIEPAAVRLAKALTIELQPFEVVMYCLAADPAQ